MSEQDEQPCRLLAACEPHTSTHMPAVDDRGAEILDRVNAAMANAGVSLSDIEPDGQTRPRSSPLADACNGRRRFTTLHLALIAESCGTSVESLLGIGDPQRSITACRSADITWEG